MAWQRRDPTSFQSGTNARINPVGPSGDVGGGRSIGNAIDRKYGAGVSPAPAPRAAPSPAGTGRGRRRSALRAAPQTVE